MPRKIFERQLAEVADDITSICERVVYIVQGTMEELNVPKHSSS